MCTLSWQMHDDHLSLVFNRDELLTRNEAVPPQIYAIDGIRFLAPVDSEAGGTWLSGNEFGMVLTLLNNYSSPQDNMGDRSIESRGHLVKKLAVRSSVREITSALNEEDLTRYRPFDLFAFSGMTYPHQWSWDGSALREIIAPENPAVSSSLHFPLVKKWRSRLFRKMTKGSIKRVSHENQLRFHHQRSRLLPAYSVAMKRADRATVSITHVMIGPDYIRMRYKTGDIVAAENSFHNSFLPVNPQNIMAYQAGQRIPFKEADLIHVLKEKNKGLHGSLTFWAFPIIRVVAMEKSINKILMATRDLDARHFAQALLNHLGVTGRLHSNSIEMPDAESRPLFVANHPTGGLDGLLMLSLLLQYYPSSKMIVNDVLEHISPLRPVIIPVDLYQHSRKSAEILHEAFAGNDALLVFPAGRTGRIHNGLVRDFQWNKMPVRLAQKYNRTIVPVYIKGRNSWRFNTVARLRSLLGITLNLEMLLLAREFLKPANKTFNLFLGEPIRPGAVQKLAGRDSERAEQLRKISEEISLGYSRELVQ
ncbi:MAG: NRDE family protein [Cyclonatronaceae bacterium]